MNDYTIVSQPLCQISRSRSKVGCVKVIDALTLSSISPKRLHAPEARKFRFQLMQALAAVVNYLLKGNTMKTGSISYVVKEVWTRPS